MAAALDVQVGGANYKNMAIQPVEFIHRNRIGWTFAAAMQNPLRARVIEALAHQIRTAEWKAQRRRDTRLVRRLQPASGRWCTQRVAGDWDDQQQTICTNDE